MTGRLFIGLACSLVSQAVTAAVSVHAEHPRIYVTPRDLPDLRRKCAGPFRRVYRAMDRAAWIMKQRPKTTWSDCHNIGYPAFKYLVTGERKYLAKTKEFLDALVAHPPRDQYLTPEWIRSGCMAADWVWNGLTPAERRRYGLGLLGLAEWVLKNVWRFSDFCNHFANEHLSVLYVAVLLDGERIAPARVAKLMKIGREYLLRHAMPAADEIAGKRTGRAEEIVPWNSYRAEAPQGGEGPCFVGGQAEGFSYNDWGYARPLALTCEMWRTATGQDVFRRSSFFRGQSIWHAYALRPDTGTFARSEDCPSGHRPGGNLKTFMHLLAARLRDPLAEWLARKYSWRYPQAGWKEILWRDSKLTARSPADLGLPLAACFPKLGHVYFRSAWGRRDAAFALFQCGPFYAGHQHLDNNTFVIHRSGSLAIDSGTNDYTSHRANYYSRTIAHNGVLVFDSTERFGGRVWGGGGGGGSNDGGQMRARGLARVGQWKPGCPSDVGRIVRFVNRRHFALCVGDATRSYSPRKIRKAVRTFVHLRPDPQDEGRVDTFLVFDRVEVARKGLRAMWVLHCIEKPTVEGDRFTITHAGGKLLGQVLVPAGAKFALVGGPGRESFVDGRNYPPVKKKPDPEAGAWRIEFPFRSTALVVLTAVDRRSKLRRPPVAWMGARAGFHVTAGRLRFTFVGDPARSLPMPSVLRDGKPAGK